MKFKQSLAHFLGLVTQEEITDFVKKQLNGIDQNNRPFQRQGFLIGQPIAPDMKITDYLKAYEEWVYTCVRAIAEETANIELQLNKRVRQTEFEVVDSHPVLDLLYKVNPLYTSYLLWESTQAYMELTGECFWQLVGPVNRPTEIWLLRPDWVQLKDAPNKLIVGYDYGPAGDKKIFIPFEQVVQFKDFNPVNAYRGHGPVKASAKTIDIDSYSTKYNRDFFFNSAIPGGAITTEQSLTDRQRRQMKDDWESVHKGPGRAWKIALLEAGLKWQDIGMNRKEMDFTEGKKATRDDILARFRVPKTLVAITEDVNLANAREARVVFLENVITPKMKRIVSFLNEFLLPRYGDEDLFFSFKNPVPNDTTQQLAIYDNGLRHGWMTRNEVREKENLEPVDGGDTLMVPFSLQAIGTLGDTAKKLQRLRTLFTFNVRVKPYSYLRSQMDAMTLKIEQKVEKLLCSITKNRVINKLSTPIVDKSKAEDGEVVDEREMRWRTVITRTDPREVRYKHVLNDLFTKQEEDVKQRVDTELRRAFGKDEVIPKEKYIKIMGKVRSNIDDITDVVRDNDVFAAPLMDLVRAMIESEGIEQIQNLVDNVVFYMQTKEIIRYLKKDGAKYVTLINEETRDQLKRELAAAIDNQESIPQIKERVTRVYDDARGYRAERIARSEVLRATNFATEQAYKQSGVVEAKEWLTAKDERVCPECGPLDGNQIDLDKSFSKNKLGAVEHPPLHPNCRCTLLPVVESNKGAKPQMTRDTLLKEFVGATLNEVRKSLQIDTTNGKLLK